MRRFAALLPWVLFLLALATVGCGGPSLVPVQGKVTVAGKPLETGNVTFHPDKEGGNTQAYPVLPTGTVDKDGKYTLSTGGKPGAPPGKYKVTITSTTPSDPKNPYSLPKHLIDQVNSAVETTTIRKEVKANSPADQYDVKLEK